MSHRLACALLLLGMLRTAFAAPLLAVYFAEGSASSNDTTAALAGRVGQVVGEPMSTSGARSALQHWGAVRAGDGALVAVESVQFGAWRIHRQGYRLLAVSARTVSYSVVTRPGITVLDVEDLSGLRIAVPAPPSLPALQLLALFPDPLRAPRLHHVDDLAHGLALLRGGAVDAAVLIEPVSRALGDVREVLTLEETPVAVVSVAPDARPALLDRLRELLPDGFVAAGVAAPALATGGSKAPADDEMTRYARLLGGTWGALR